MRKFQMDSPRWRAVKEAWLLGVPLRLIAALADLVPKTITLRARLNGWPPHPGEAAPIGAVHAADDPQGIRANMMAAVARRFGALSFADLGDEEKLAKAMGALVKTTEAAGRLTAAFGEDGKGMRDGGRSDDLPEDDPPDDDQVRASIRRKLQAFLGRARTAGPE